MSCIEKKRKPMVPMKTLDVIFRRRHLPNTQYYFTNREHALKKHFAKPSKPFQVPRSQKLLSYIKYSDRREKLDARERSSQPLHLKDNLKLAAIRDLSRRLYMPEPPDDVRTVLEIHPEFYTVIEGRPLRRSDDIKVYLSNIRGFTMNRQQIGYRRDLVLKLDSDMAEEAKGYDKIADNYRQHIKNFQQFLTEDYKKACLKQSKQEKVHQDLVAKNAEFLGYVSKITILNNVIFKLDAIRSILKIYRSYLMFVAPLSWRQKFDETLRGKVQSIQFEAGAFATDNDLVESLDIDKTVEFAVIEFKNPLSAHLYFSNSEEMIYIFRSMEMQSREYLIHLSKTGAPHRILKNRIIQLKRSTQQELDYFQYYIDNINIEINREIYNEQHLQEKFYRILNGPFYTTVASPSTLKLKICIEYVYEQIFGKCEEGHQSLQDPMKILEVMYEDYNLRLDALDFKIVNQARADFFAQDLKMMKNAYHAERELRAFEELTNAMNKAFLSPGKFTRPAKKNTDKPGKSETSLLTTATEGGNRTISKCSLKSQKSTKSMKIFKLTDEEREGLTLFTNWCEGTNPAPFLREYYDFVVPTFKWKPRKSVLPEF